MRFFCFGINLLAVHPHACGEYSHRYGAFDILPTAKAGGFPKGSVISYEERKFAHPTTFQSDRRSAVVPS